MFSPSYLHLRFYSIIITLLNYHCYDDIFKLIFLIRLLESVHPFYSVTVLNVTQLYHFYESDKLFN